MNNELFSKRLSETLRTKNITQKQLAELTNLTPATISQYVNGQIRPTEKRLHDISKALDVSPVWLLGYDNDAYVLGIQALEKNNRITKLFDQLNSTGKDKVIAYAEDLLDKYGKDK